MGIVWSYLRRPNWTPATDTPLYTSKKINKWLPIVLWAILTVNCTLFVLCVVCASSAYYYWYQSSLNTFVQVLYFCTIPTVQLALSAFDLHKRRTRSLRAVQVVVSGTFSSCAWFVAMGCWVPSIGGYSTIITTPGVLVFMLIPAFLLQFAYLTLGAVSVDRQRHAQWVSERSGNTSKEEKEPKQLEAAETVQVDGLQMPEEAYKGNSGAHSAAPSIRSEVPSGVQSPNRPPSKHSTILSSLPPYFDETRSLASTTMFRDSKSYHICRHCGTVDEE